MLLLLPLGALHAARHLHLRPPLLRARLLRAAYLMRIGMYSVAVFSPSHLSLAAVAPYYLL